MVGRAAQRDEPEITYKEVVHSLLRTHVTDHAITEAYNNVGTYKQSSAQTKMDYSNKIYDKPVR